jgi:hypothetical protein
MRGALEKGRGDVLFAWEQVNYSKFALAIVRSQEQCSEEFFSEHHETSTH